jgi:hypothetical protein
VVKEPKVKNTDKVAILAAALFGVSLVQFEIALGTRNFDAASDSLFVMGVLAASIILLVTAGYKPDDE